MKIFEYLDIIKNTENYINNSLKLKSSDNDGCIYNWLTRISSGNAIRNEIFIELNAEESEITLLDKTAVSNIEVYPAH